MPSRVSFGPAGVLKTLVLDLISQMESWNIPAWAADPRFEDGLGVKSLVSSLGGVMSEFASCPSPFSCAAEIDAPEFLYGGY